MAKQAKRQLAGSGETLPAGAVGEVLVNTSTSQLQQASPAAGTYYGPSGIPVLTLTPGVWVITGQCLLEAVLPSATSARIALNLRLQNATDSTTVTSIGSIFLCEQNFGGSAAIQAIVNITSSKGYKLEYGFSMWSGATPTIANINARGDVHTSYLRAVRIA